MAKSSNIQMVFNDVEKERLMELASKKKVNTSVVIRECVKRILENYANG